MDADTGVRSRGVRIGGTIGNYNATDIIFRTTGGGLVSQYLDQTIAADGWEWRRHTSGASFANAMTLTPAGVVTATTFVGALTGEASGNLPLTGGVLTGDLQVGNATTGSADRTLTVSSRNFAELILAGDSGNLSGEPGGASVLLSQDGGSVFGWLGIVQLAGEDGRGGAFTGTSGNSLLLGSSQARDVHLGTGGDVKLSVISTGVSVSGGLSVSGAGAIVGNMTWGNSSANAVHTFSGDTFGGFLRHGTTTGTMNLSGGSSSVNGANVNLHGGSHATDPNLGELRTGSTARLSWDTSGVTMGAVTTGRAAVSGATVTTENSGVLHVQATTNAGVNAAVISGYINSNADSRYLLDLRGNTSGWKVGATGTLVEGTVPYARVTGGPPTGGFDTAGNGLFSSGTTVTLGTPSGITESTVNTATTSSHTHAINMPITGLVGVHGQGGTVTTNINVTSNTSLRSKTIGGSLAAGDTVVMRATVLEVNTPGPTHTYTVTISGLGIEFTVGGAATTTATRKYLHFEVTLGIQSTAFAAIAGKLTYSSAITEDTPLQTTATTTFNWRTSASNLTGASKTAVLSARSASTTATQTAQVISFTVETFKDA